MGPVICWSMVWASCQQPPLLGRQAAPAGQDAPGRAAQQLGRGLPADRGAHPDDDFGDHRRAQAAAERQPPVAVPHRLVELDYGIAVRTAAPFADAVARVREALQAQGFGMLTEIDVQATLRGKLGVDTEPYLILGACNPSLARQALNADRRIGLLLPCNVVVRAEAGQTVIEALDPQAMVAVAGQPSLQPVADEAATRLRAALDTLREAD